MWVGSLGEEDPLEEGMATHPSILAWKIPWTEEPGGLLSFPIVMYRSENWTIKKAECQRIDAFKLWCWRRCLRGPWTARRSNQSILKEIKHECSFTDAEAPVLWPPNVKSKLTGKDPDAGKD